MLDQVRTSFRCWMAAKIAMPVIVAILALSIDISAQQKPSVVGDYTATIDSTHIFGRLHLKLNDKGELTGSFDIPDEYEVADPLEDIHFDGQTLRFSVAGHNGFWESVFASDGNSLTGNWSEWGVQSPLTFIRDAVTVVTKLSPVDGIWLGALPAGTASLRLQVIVKSDAAGQSSCTADSPDQRVMGMQCAQVAFSGDRFSFDIPIVAARWSGRLSADGKALEGTFTQDGAGPLNFQRQSTALLAQPVPPPAYDPALPPVDVTGLQSVLDRDLAEALRSGELASSTRVGVSIGVVEHGVRRIFSYGAAKPDSIFEIGSTTKTFTGLMLAQLVAQGNAKLDEAVRELLPPGTVAKPDGQEITLLDLATRRSGLPRFPTNMRLDVSENPYAEYHADDLYAFLGNNGVAKVKQEGGLAAYSDLGFGLLGQALANRVGISYPALLREEIAGPLGMDDTTISLAPDQKLRFIPGTNGTDHRLAHALEFDAFAGAGAIRSTAGDMLTYLEANLHPESLKPVPGFAGDLTISSALSLSHQLQDADIRPGMRIALAWLYQTNTGNYWHNGATAGYSSYVFFNPQGDYAGAVLLNAAPGVDDSFVDRLGQHIIQRLSSKSAISLAN